MDVTEKIKLIFKTVVIGAAFWLVISIAQIFSSYRNIDDSYLTVFSSLLCGVFVVAKLKDTPFGKVTYGIMTIVLSLIVFYIVQTIPYVIVALGI